MQDIVFQEFYSQKVNEHIIFNMNQKYLEGRQTGWMEIINIVEDMKNKKISISSENIKKELIDYLNKNK